MPRSGCVSMPVRVPRPRVAARGGVAEAVAADALVASVAAGAGGDAPAPRGVVRFPPPEAVPACGRVGSRQPPTPGAVCGALRHLPRGQSSQASRERAPWRPSPAPSGPRLVRWRAASPPARLGTRGARAGDTPGSRGSRGPPGASRCARVRPGFRCGCVPFLALRSERRGPWPRGRPVHGSAGFPLRSLPPA